MTLAATCISCGLSALLVFTLSAPARAVDAEQVPPPKRTALGLYLDAQEAHQKLQSSPDAVFFLDARTQAEVMFVGVPAGLDAHVPYLLADFDYFDAKAGRYALTPNPRFAQDVAQRLAAKGMGKDSEIVVICRSGDRSARAVNDLAKLGYTRVYTVIDGFEGDLAKEGPDKGHRSINGWKNAKLPWNTQVEAGVAYSPEAAPPSGGR